MNNETRQEIVDMLGRIARAVEAESPVQQSGRNATPSGSTPTPPIVVQAASTPVATWTPQMVNFRLPPRSSVLSEQREAVAPYQPRRALGRATRRLEPVVQTVVYWNQRCFCLGGPEDVRTPRFDRKLHLISNGLGDSVIITDTNSSRDNLKQTIMEMFPKLQGHEIEFLRAAGGGRCKPLVRVSSIEAIPSIQYIKAARIGTLFIRPLTNLPLEQNVEMPEVPNNAEPNVANNIHQPRPIADQVNLRHSGPSSQVEEQNIPSSAEPTPCSSSSMQQLTSTAVMAELITMIDFRERSYEENPGIQYIHVRRDNFLEQILGVYKNPSFNFLQKPKVEFQGEPGADIGALTREYFWKGLISICQDKLDGRSLFEGQPDHLVPSCDAKLVRSGVFAAVGMFMAHAAIHCGIAFLGLSEAAAEYLLIDSVDTDTPISIVLDDVVDLDVREALHLIRTFQDGAILTEESRAQITNVTETYDVYEGWEGLTRSNASYIFDHILYTTVIEKRKSQLDALKKGFQKCGLIDFLSGKMYLKEGLFPRQKDITYPAEMLVDKLDINVSEESDRITAYVMEFIRTLEGDQKRIQNLLSAWTGWPVIPEGNLTLNIKDDVEFMAHACFNDIEIPSSFTKEDVVFHFNMLIDFGSAGFGAT